MSSGSVQLTFTLRTSSNVRTVHLVGSWDGYKSQLPLSSDPSGKAGAWKGNFRFQGSHALKLGSRYWYYYLIDGYHVSHDPAKEYMTEKTTGKKLNILDVPGGKGDKSRPAVQTNTSRNSRDVPQGRALSPGKIQHPKPSKPYASRQLREADYDESPIDDLEERFAGTRISEYDRHHGSKYSGSPSTLSDSSSSGTVFSSSSGSPSSGSDASCRCERYGVTRSGQRVKLDCGGRRCGYNGSSSECSSDSNEDSDHDYRNRKGHTNARQEVRKPVHVERRRR